MSTHSSLPDLVSSSESSIVTDTACTYSDFAYYGDRCIVCGRAWKWDIEICIGSDSDGDKLCADVDSCPADKWNDADSDMVCGDKVKRF